MSVKALWQARATQRFHARKTRHEGLTLFNANGGDLDELGERIGIRRYAGETDEHYLAECMRAVRSELNHITEHWDTPTRTVTLELTAKLLGTEREGIIHTASHEKDNALHQRLCGIVVAWWRKMEAPFPPPTLS